MGHDIVFIVEYVRNRELNSLKASESSTYDQKEDMSVKLREKTVLAEDLEKENEQVIVIYVRLVCVVCMYLHVMHVHVLVCCIHVPVCCMRVSVFARVSTCVLECISKL